MLHRLAVKACNQDEHVRGWLWLQRAQGTAHRSVLLVGNPALPLKGFDMAVAVLTVVNRVLPLKVTWLCQVRLPRARQPCTACLPACLPSPAS